MRLPPAVVRPLLFLPSLYVLFSTASADKMLRATSLNACQANSGFSASLFNVVFTPGNESATINMAVVSSVEGSVFFDVTLRVYGYPAIRTTIDPCELKMRGLCPMTSGKMAQKFNVRVPAAATKNIPGVAYTIPDLDASARVFINKTDTRESVACVEVDFSNGKTVDQLVVKWVTSIIVSLGLLASALMSVLGHNNAAAHLAANTLSLLGYFQAQAIIGLTGVHMPPIVQAWTQDFMWSIGIIRIGWMQKVFTWYQRTTGGEPTILLDYLTRISVQVQKRSLGLVEGAFDSVTHGLGAITKRANIQLGTGSYVVYGIQRAAFRAKIESTNVFMTSLTLFYCLAAFVIVAVAAAKAILQWCIRQKWTESERALDFCSSWLNILKGILLRVTLIASPPMTIFSLWELTQVDSPAEIVLAVFCFCGMFAALGWAAFKIISIARHSIATHQNPAHHLFSDPQVLGRWGFLYIQFRASASYYILPVLAYTIFKGAFVSFGQHVGAVQSIAFILIELAALVSASILRPWMDKTTNSFNIAISVMNALNSIFLLLLTDVFGAPAVVASVSGVILFIANSAFSLVLLIMIIASCILFLWHKNPDNRYRLMDDDRVSLMKSQTQVDRTSELDTLAATTRDDELDSANFSQSMSPKFKTDHYYHLSPSSTNNQPRSPVDPSLPLFPADSQNGARYDFDSALTPRRGSPATIDTAGPSYRSQNNSRCVLYLFRVNPVRQF
ncbi:hypothetical protein FOCG_07359 [Fusarium oxysporum f. sp. radicis-lycopersici 26381]|nr:hypothetical protein FOCG_07359 [Fusarium oxysporum f. sp. radicis-lycopersici 26381]